MNDFDLIKIAEVLRNACYDHVFISPIRNIIGENNEHDAYAIQMININKRIESGSTVTGKKIGLTSKAVRQQLGVDEPDFGFLLSDMLIEDNGEISFKKLHQPKVEGEIAFTLCRDIDIPITNIEVMRSAIDYVQPSIEIVGSRIYDWDIKLADTIADNASASHYVIGHKKLHLSEIDFDQCNMNLFINGELKSSGNAKACMDNPLNACIWLANKMIDLGQPLKKGEIILSGALGPFVDVKCDDHCDVVIDTLGSVSVNFIE